VFPTPLRPSSARHSPAPTFSDRSSRTTVGPYPAVTRSNARSLAIGHLPLAKIDGTYVLVARDLLGRAMGHHPASLEHGDFFGEAEHQRHVMLDDHDGDAWIEAIQSRKNDAAFTSRNARSRLVQQ